MKKQLWLEEKELMQFQDWLYEIWAMDRCILADQRQLLAT